MKSLSPNELLPVLHLAFATPSAPSVHITGPASTGKTETIRRLAALTNRPLEVFDLATRTDAAEVFGYHIPMFSEGVVRYMPTDLLKKVAGTRSILFFDDFTYAEPAIKNACMRIALDRAIEHLQLGPGVNVAFATNPANFVANGTDLPPALATRLLHISTKFASVEESNRYDLADGALSAPSLPSWTPEEWAREHVIARAHISSFRLSRPTMATETPENAAGAPIPAYATPRGFTAFARLYATSRAANDLESRLVFAEGMLGPRVGGEFETWLVEADLPNPEQTLKNPTDWVVQKSRPDRVLAITMQAAAYAVAHPEYLSAAWKVLSHTIKGGMRPHAANSANYIIRSLVENAPASTKLKDDAMEVLREIKKICTA